MPFSRTKFAILIASCGALLAAPARPQDSPPATSVQTPAVAAPDYSKEPFVFESYATKVRFESDGTGERGNITRIRVQSEAGVQALGELTFGYNSANEQLNIQYVRVHKSDGSVVTADASAIKELTPEVEKNAPVYTDYKEKHVTVPSLKPGDTLEYETDMHISTPLAPGEFWFAQNFLKDAIILDESLEVNLPEARGVKIASPDAEYQTKRDSGRVIYTWKHAQTSHPSDEEQAQQTAQAGNRAPDVQLTTFKNWDDVAKWYASLEQGRAEPNAEIRAKVAALTQGKTTDAEKIQPLYDYVAKNIRYVSLSFGLGRYQPHTAAEVFKNQYGDCKDKTILLASMMRAAGVASDVALLPTSGKLDEEMPSPSQFDHIITAVPEAGNLIWLDSTTEVAPYRMLAASLRDKSALLVAPDGKGKIVRTPADPPFLSTQNVEIEGTVSELGKLTGTVHYTVRGDQELLLRLAFRQTTQKSWSKLGDAVLQQDGLDGTATSVEVTNPDDTQSPFQLTIHFTQDDFLPWTGKEPSVKLPLLSIGLPAVADDNAAPIELGSPLNVNVRLKLTLPADFKARAPVGIAASRDYAEFKSTYSLDGQTLTAQRSIDFKLHEIPAERTSDYLAFTHAVSSDENQSLHLENLSTGPLKVPADAKIEDVMDAAEVELKSGEPLAAIPLLQRVVELDPKKYEKAIWNDFGLAYVYSNQSDKAVSAFRKQLEINPYDQNTNRYLAVVLVKEEKIDEAIAAYRKQLEISPLDLASHIGLGTLYSRQQRNTEAVAELQKAAAIKPDDAAIETALGSVYLDTNQPDKALDAFDQAVQRSPSPVVWNNVAYELASHKVALDKAQQYAESAVSSTDADLRNFDLAHAKATDIQSSTVIASYWDTLGWVHFQEGDFAKAERFLRAAWALNQSGTVGDHLGQLLAKLGQKDQAAEAYAQALATPHPDTETRSHMILLLGGNGKIDLLVSSAQPKLAAERTFNAGNLADAKAEAKFEFLLSPSGVEGSSTHIDDTKFISGDDALRDAAEKLRALDLGPMFPDATPTKLIRTGTISCTDSGSCSLIFDLQAATSPLP